MNELHRLPLSSVRTTIDYWNGVFMWTPTAAGRWTATGTLSSHGLLVQLCIRLAC